MDGDRAVVGGIEPVGAGDRIDIAVENEADDIAAGIDQRTS
jgi:hypothetical protein